MAKLEVPDNYPEFLEKLSERIQIAQVKAGLAVNRELVLLYWQIGRDISERMSAAQWGSKVIEQLSKDIAKNFPGVRSFSARNLQFMRRFAETWEDEEMVKQLVSQIPWGHNIRLIQAVKNHDQRIWYIRKTIENGWSRNVLVHQIESDLYARQGSAPTNFQHTLPKTQSDLAGQILKDPYNFDFITLSEDAPERELQRSLIEHIRDFMLELGVGFAFVGDNVKLEVGDEEFYLDLLLYHLQLRCYVVIELKTGKYKPEYAGKMNFYLTAVDEIKRHADDQPSIGIILCREKNKLVVEYSLRNMDKPIGVPEYRLTEALPDSLADQLPSVEQLEAELQE